LAETPSAFFLAVRKKYEKAGSQIVAGPAPAGAPSVSKERPTEVDGRRPAAPAGGAQEGSCEAHYHGSSTAMSAPPISAARPARRMQRVDQHATLPARGPRTPLRVFLRAGRSRQRSRYATRRGCDAISSASVRRRPSRPLQATCWTGGWSNPGSWNTFEDAVCRRS